MLSGHLAAWFVLIPVALAGIAPGIAALGARRRALDAYYPAAHLVYLILAIIAFDSTPLVAEMGLRGAPASARLLFVLDRFAATQLALVGLLYLVLASFAVGIVRDARHGRAFLTLLLWQHLAIALILFAGDLLALYLGLLLVSLSLALMIGLDFGVASRGVAFRVLATLEVPAAIALAGIWIVDGRAGTTALADLAQTAPWLAGPGALALTIPIAVALLTRAGLFPLQAWATIGCRTAGGPVTVAIAAIVIPVGALVLARLIAVLPLDPRWLTVLVLLAVATALLASLGALGERTWRGWLAYAALAQSASAIAGFATGSTTGRSAGWYLLGGGTAAILLAGLGLMAANRQTESDAQPRLDPRALGSAPVLAIAAGYLTVAAVPPFAGFVGRQALIASLLDRGSTVDVIGAIGVLLATAALGASIWRQLVGSIISSAPPSVVATAKSAAARGRASKRGKTAKLPGPSALDRPAPFPHGGGKGESVERSSPPSPWVGKGVRGRGGVDDATWIALAAAGGIVVVLGLVPSQWLASLAGVTPAPPAAGSNAVAAIVVGGAIGLGLTVEAVRSKSAAVTEYGWRALRPLLLLQKRYGLTRAADPYLVVGALIFGLGRLSAIVLDNTLGRLVRSS